MKQEYEYAIRVTLSTFESLTKYFKSKKERRKWLKGFSKKDTDIRIIRKWKTNFTERKNHWR